MSAIAERDLATLASDTVTRARVLLQRGQAADALAELHPLLDGPQTDPAALDCAAMCCWELGASDNALKLLGMITKTWPNLFEGWTKLAAMAASLGQKNRAKDALEHALQLKPRSVSALTALNNLAPIDRNSLQVSYLRDASRSNRVPVADRIMALNTLGRIEERAGNLPPAFRHFKMAKSLTAGHFDPDAIDALVDGQTAFFRRRAHASGVGPRIVFIVGMPRSGTTLLERMLGRHDGTYTIGESKALSKTLVEARRYVAVKFGGAGAWDWIEHLDDTHLAAFQLRFLEHLGVPHAQRDKLIVTKMPLDCLDIGFANWIFPQAKFVFLQRDPRDVGLSNFCTNFHETNSFTKRLSWIGRLTKSVYRSAADYEAKLGDAFRRQSYAALVKQPEQQMRGVFKHIGLPWDPACLSPERSNTVTRTASLFQVQEAISQNGLGKWRAYETQLAPLIETLGEPWLEEWSLMDAKLGGQSNYRV